MLTLSNHEIRQEDVHLRLGLERAFPTGDAAILKRVYDEYDSLVYSICRRSVDDATALDITQDVFITAWNKRERYDPDRGGLGGWLTAITRNKIIDHFRAQASEERRINKAASSAEREETSVQRIHEIADRMLLVDAMDELGERAHKVISLAFFEDLTHAAIAERTGIPLGTVKSDIRRGLDQLRHSLRHSNE